jgi:hypothetical protein
LHNPGAKSVSISEENLVTGGNASDIRWQLINMNGGIHGTIHVRAAPAFCRDSDNKRNRWVLVYVGPRANEEHAGNVCEDLQHMVPVNEVVSGARETALKLLKLPRPYPSISGMLRAFFMAYVRVVVPISCHHLPRVHLAHPLALDDTELVLIEPLGIPDLAVMHGRLVQKHPDLCWIPQTKRPSRTRAALQ